MRREAYAVIGIEQPWQEYRAAVFLNDGRWQGVSMPIPTLPSSSVVPAPIRRRMWRECVKILRGAT